MSERRHEVVRSHLVSDARDLRLEDIRVRERRNVLRTMTMLKGDEMSGDPRLQPRMTRLLLKMARQRAREHELIMRAIEAAHKVYPKRRR